MDGALTYFDSIAVKPKSLNLSVSLPDFTPA